MVLSLLCTFVAHITFLHVFFLPPLSFSLSLSLLSCFLFLSLSLSFSLPLSLYLCPLFLSVVARHMSSDALYQIFSSWSILLFHTISFHSSYKIHQLFTDYLLRLPSSELLEKHLFRSRANRRLVSIATFDDTEGSALPGEKRSIYIAQPSPIAPLTAIAPKAASQQHLTQPVSFDGHEKEICHWIVKWKWLGYWNPWVISVYRWSLGISWPLVLGKFVIFAVPPQNPES